MTPHFWQPAGKQNLINSVRKHNDQKGLQLNVKKNKMMETDNSKGEAKLEIGGE